MAAVVRLKRHLSEEPLGALVINCKRQKKDDDDATEETETKTVLKFAGTIKEHDEDLAPHISNINKSHLEQTFKKHTPDISLKNRQLLKNSSKNNRYKIVNLSRSINIENESATNSTDDEKLVTTVLDIETEAKDDDDKSPECNFVYDLYYTTSGDFDDCLDAEKIDKICNVLPAGAELVYDNYRDGVVDDSDASSEDSNAENFWRNDYPDEDDDMHSIDGDDMREVMGNLNLENDLSDDDGEEGFVYSIDSEGAGFEEDLDHSDVRRYGEMYARFKAKQKMEEEKYNKDMYHDEVVDNDDEDYYD